MSLRAWLLLRQADIVFEGEVVGFNEPDFGAAHWRRLTGGKRRPVPSESTVRFGCRGADQTPRNSQ